MLIISQLKKFWSCPWNKFLELLFLANQDTLSYRLSLFCSFSCNLILLCNICNNFYKLCHFFLNSLKWKWILLRFHFLRSSISSENKTFFPNSTGNFELYLIYWHRGKRVLLWKEVCVERGRVSSLAHGWRYIRLIAAYQRPLVEICYMTWNTNLPL